MKEENITIEDVRELLGDESDTVWIDYEEDDNLVLDENGIVRKLSRGDSTDPDGDRPSN